MKYLKMLGLAAIAAGALMAFAGAGTASATELTCTNPPGTKVMCAAGTIIHAVSEGHAVLDPPIGKIECNSTVEGKATTGGSSETVKSEGELTALTFTNCTGTPPPVVTVIKKGTLEVHGSALSHNGTLTSNGAEVTVEAFGSHCIFTTSNTDIGTLTASGVTASGKPTLDIEATIPRTGGRSGAFCGSEAKWTGSYEVDSPSWMEIDP